MSIKLLLSQPAGGKTSACIRRILEIRKKDPFSPVKVIVPDKMQMAFWKRMLSLRSVTGVHSGGFIGTEVISFSKLAVELLHTAGKGPLLIPARLDSMCIREAVIRASKDRPLDYFEPIRGKPGLLSVFKETLRTLQQECITPEMLESASHGDPKTDDTVRVYREYLELLKQNNWVGSAGLLSAATALAETNQASFPRCPLLAADGFDRFPNDALHLLRALSPLCDEILLTLPGCPDSEAPTDQRLTDEAKKISAVLGAEIVTDIFRKPETDLLKLADSVFYPEKTSPDRSISCNSFLMIEASSRTAEVREALRELKRRIIMEKLKPADCAVFVPDMNAYAPIISQFGREMGIPLRFSQKQPLSKSPAASALKRLLRLPPAFDTEQLLSVLRLPFFSGCPDPAGESGGNFSADLFVLDKVGRKMNVVSGLNEWQTAFARAALSAPETKAEDAESYDEPDEGRVYEYPDRKKLDRIRSSFLKFADCLMPPDGTRSRADWIKWLEELLDTIRFYEQVEDRNGRSFEDDFNALLKRIVFCESELKQPPVAYDEFLGELEAEMDSAIQTEPEFTGDRVFVGDISQTSGCRWQLTVLTGFAEGVFPRAEHEELILTASLRDKLEIPYGTDQQLMFHHAFTRSEKSLIITRPMKTDKGEEWPESIFWQNIRRNLKENSNLLTVTENMPVTAASLDEFAFRLARSGQKDVPETIPPAEAEDLRMALEKAADELATAREQADGRYSPCPDPALKSALADPARDAVPYSCSAIETWLTCPFRYFLSGKLRLEQQIRTGTGMDAAQIGSLNHRVMELAFPPGTVYGSKEEALERAEKVIEQVFATAPREFGFRESELWRYEKAVYRQKLLESIERMFSSSKMPMDGKWKSVGAEMKFGYPEDGKKNTEPLRIETESGPIRIRGIIDRVDQRDDGLLRVVDYKTGLPGFTPAELEAGSHIQAGVYAAAAVHALRLGSKCEGMYWSINSKTVREYLMYDSETEEEVPKLTFLNKFTAGVQDAAYPAEPAGGTCPDYCPAASWCRRYSRREKYG